MITHEAFRAVVVMHKLCDVEYFMDKLENWELTEMLNVCAYSHYHNWEIARIMCYFFSSPYLKQKTTAKELFPLYWDEDEKKKIKESLRTDITDEEIRQMRELSKTMAINLQQMGR